MDSRQRGSTGSSVDRLASVPDSTSPAFAARHPLSKAFDNFAATVTRWAGSPIAFCAALVSVFVWIVTGPLFHYSDAWQLVINTGTTIITFLMVFLIQQSQNKDSVAVHLKLNELLAANRSASNSLIGIEDASEEDLRRVAEAYLKLAENASRKSEGAARPEVERSASAAQQHCTAETTGHE